jgi:hypothetical protein
LLSASSTGEELRRSTPTARHYAEKLIGNARLLLDTACLATSSGQPKMQPLSHWTSSEIGETHHLPTRFPAAARRTSPP